MEEEDTPGVNNTRLKHVTQEYQTQQLIDSSNIYSASTEYSSTLCVFSEWLVLQAFTFCCSCSISADLMSFGAVKVARSILQVLRRHYLTFVHKQT